MTLDDSSNTLYKQQDSKSDKKSKKPKKEGQVKKAKKSSKDLITREQKENELKGKTIRELIDILLEK